MARPRLTAQTALVDFRDFYWLKEELVAFCRRSNLSTAGPKAELTERIAVFLKTGVHPSKDRARKGNATKKSPMPATLSRSTVMGSGWCCSEELRAFFEAEIGPQFHFNQVMRDFVKHGAGKTLQAGIAAWAADQSGQKAEKEIGPQFEYNRHMRAYFQAYPNATRGQAIAAWHQQRDQRKEKSR